MLQGRVTSHFSQRARERGITETCTETLWNDLRDRIAAGDLEHVLTYRKMRYWRFHVDEGIFYVLTSLNGCVPITVYTQDMMRNKKWAAKMAKKGMVRP